MYRNMLIDCENQCVIIRYGRGGLPTPTLAPAQIPPLLAVPLLSSPPSPSTLVYFPCTMSLLIYFTDSFGPCPSVPSTCQLPEDRDVHLSCS